MSNTQAPCWLIVLFFVLLASCCALFLLCYLLLCCMFVYILFTKNTVIWWLVMYGCHCSTQFYLIAFVSDPCLLQKLVPLLFNSFLTELLHHSFSFAFSTHLTVWSWFWLFFCFAYVNVLVQTATALPLDLGNHTFIQFDSSVDGTFPIESMDKHFSDTPTWWWRGLRRGWKTGPAASRLHTWHTLLKALTRRTVAAMTPCRGWGQSSKWQQESNYSWQKLPWALHWMFWTCCCYSTEESLATPLRNLGADANVAKHYNTKVIERIQPQFLQDTDFPNMYINIYIYICVCAT